MFDNSHFDMIKEQPTIPNFFAPNDHSWHGAAINLEPKLGRILIRDKHFWDLLRQKSGIGIIVMRMI
jgi:hypothetical protein